MTGTVAPNLIALAGPNGAGKCLFALSSLCARRWRGRHDREHCAARGNPPPALVHNCDDYPDSCSSVRSRSARARSGLVVQRLLSSVRVL